MREVAVALVTGGGTGIGPPAAARSREAASASRCTTAPAARRPSALAAELPDAFAVRADLAAPAEVEALVGGARRRAPAALDVLVNNAGANRNGADAPP